MSRTARKGESMSKEGQVMEAEALTEIPLTSRWDRLIELLHRVQAAAWLSAIDDPTELSRREARVDTVMKALVETAPPDYFSVDDQERR